MHFALYRGEFLEGLEIREPAFEEWMLSERYRLSELAAGAFARLLELQTDRGDPRRQSTPPAGSSCCRPSTKPRTPA